MEGTNLHTPTVGVLCLHLGDFLFASRLYTNLVSGYIEHAILRHPSQILSRLVRSLEGRI